MACPMGFTLEDLARVVQNEADKDTLDERFPEKPCETISEPHEIRKMAKEIIYLTGGQYCLLMQWLHPGIARSNVEHSDLENHLLEHVETISQFLNAITYGTELEKRAICHTIHKKNAVVFGENYHADDPEVHRWTAATLYMSLKVAHETFFYKLSRREEERLYKECAIYGTSLQMPTDWWPATLDDFYVYWNHNVDTLPVTPYAQTLFKQLMYPKHIPLWMKPYAPFARLYTAQWLPPRLQKEYGLQNNNLERGVYKVLTNYIRLTYPLIPRRLRQHRHKARMNDLRETVKAMGKPTT